jgi:anti-anti-sigma factor
LKVEKKDNNYIFTLSGELTLPIEEKIKKEIIDTLQNDTEYKNVYIKMSNVPLVDSSGIGMLVYISRFLNSHQKALHLISPSPSVLEILRLGSFDKLFKIED